MTLIPPILDVQSADETLQSDRRNRLMTSMKPWIANAVFAILLVQDFSWKLFGQIPTLGPTDILLAEAQAKQLDGNPAQLVGYLWLKDDKNAVIVSSWSELMNKDFSKSVRIQWRAGYLTDQTLGNSHEDYCRKANGAYVSVKGKFVNNGPGVGSLLGAENLVRLRGERITCEAVRMEPEKFNGMWMEVVAYIHREEQRIRLFTSREAYEAKDLSRSLLADSDYTAGSALSFDAVGRNGDLIVCEGFFAAGDRDAEGGFGRLRRVWAFRKFDPSAYGWTQKK